MMLLVGLFQAISMVTISSALLGKAPPTMRGRIMGLRQLAVYTLAFGSSIDGAMARAWGVPNAVMATSAVGIVLVLVLFASIPKLNVPRPIRDDPLVAVPA